jgi:hypothetical protein
LYKDNRKVQGQQGSRGVAESEDSEKGRGVKRIEGYLDSE